ncbi:MAG: hypothetical protein J6X50_03410 [Bacilli bacterium]|nr:hypothetical protein [Bacilli bacterium]
MRKHVVFLISGLVLCAASIGFFRTNTFQKVEAASESKKLSYDENGKITLGSFPLNFDVKLSDDALNIDGLNASFVSGIDSSLRIGGIDITTVNGVRYGYIGHTSLNYDGGYDLGSDKLPSGTIMIDSGAYRTGIFDFVPLKWVEFDKGDGYVDFISDYIVYRDQYNPTSGDIDYGKSALCARLNDAFFKIAFSNEDKDYLISKDIANYTGLYVDIPSKDIIDAKEPACSGPSDVAILEHISSKRTYKNAPYWTNSQNADDRISVKWVNDEYTNCQFWDDNIGVRPVIRINSNKLGPFKSGGSSSKTTPSNVNPAIPIGIIFGVLGVGSLVAFFILWNKKLKEDPQYKAPGWYYAIIFVATAFCCVSIITFSTQSAGGGAGGGASCFKIGYYVQVGQHSGNGIQQVGYTAWLLKSDGTVSYCSALEDNAKASDFRPDNYMTGTYTISGSKLTINIPKHEIKNFGTVGGTYTYTIKGCDSFQNSADTYQWVRGE